MPGFTPGRRWQPPYRPFHRDPFGTRLLEGVERAVKGPMFGCRMCGNCLLQETAFICPMECPKGLRNGPCGGSTGEHCYVDETRPCIWYKIYDRSFRMGRERRLLEVLPPLDWDKTGGETWADVVVQVKKVGTGNVVKGLLSRDAARRAATWESVFGPVREPEWWQGDALPHPAAYDEPASELERRLHSGQRVVTCEVSPPLSASVDKLKQTVLMLKPYVSAINFTDSPSATPRMSSWACSLAALQAGAEPVMQMTARDRTRVGLQAEVVGAAGLGVRNVLCLTGDSMRIGPGPRGRMDIVDLDSVQMLWVLRRLRDEGHYLDGRKLKTPPKYFLGAAASPFASEPKFQALREEKKVNAGAQFLQTNLVFETGRLETWLNELAKRNVLGRVSILVGIGPLKSLHMARHLRDEVPGVFVPDEVMRRMERADEMGGAAEEGLQIALELIEKIRPLQGVNGFHITASGWEEIVPRLVREAGLEPEDASGIGHEAGVPLPVGPASSEG
jgi:methylenetetrahydrofolate reductase (NADPH)